MLVFRELRYVAAERVYEQRFREFGEHALAADAAGGGFFDEMQDRVFEPVTGGVGSDVDLEDARGPTRDDQSPSASVGIGLAY